MAGIGNTRQRLVRCPGGAPRKRPPGGSVSTRRRKPVPNVQRRRGNGCVSVVLRRILSLKTRGGCLADAVPARVGTREGPRRTAVCREWRRLLTKAGVAGLAWASSPQRDEPVCPRSGPERRKPPRRALHERPICFRLRPEARRRSRLNPERRGEARNDGVCLYVRLALFYSQSNSLHCRPPARPEDRSPPGTAGTSGGGHSTHLPFRLWHRVLRSSRRTTGVWENCRRRTRRVGVHGMPAPADMTGWRLRRASAATWNISCEMSHRAAHPLNRSSPRWPAPAAPDKVEPG